MSNNNNPILLTVIIFSYNHKDTIAKAVDSVLEQDTIYSYEIWLCDDCSTDGTTTICIDYAQKHPNKVKLFAQPKNTYSNEFTHIEIALKKVKTKYLSILDGDDAWCNANKVQIALDLLENNPEYITFAHDTMFNDIEHGTKKSLVHDIYKAKIHNPVTFENILYLHTSSRIHRNVVEFPEGREAYTDLFLFYIFLDKGPLYYHNEIMSVYNITGKGAWSGLSTEDLINKNEILQYKINIFFNYKHDAFFTSRIGEVKTLKFLKRICGVKSGWEIWYNLISYKSDKNINLLKMISNLQKSQEDVSTLYYIARSKAHPDSEELIIERIEENIRVLDECYLSKELPDVILQYAKTTKINAHLIATSLYLRYGRYGKASSHLIRIGKMDFPILFSTESLKTIGIGVKRHLLI